MVESTHGVIFEAGTIPTFWINHSRSKLMGGYESRMGGNQKQNYNFDHLPFTDVSFDAAYQKARAGERLSLEDGVALMTVQHHPGQKALVLELADQRRKDVVGNDITFVANMNLNVTTACTVGCLFCNYKDSAHLFEVNSTKAHEGFTRAVEETRALAQVAVDSGVYEVCSVSGLHPALVLNDDHRRLLEKNPVNYKPSSEFKKDPGSYVDQIKAMKVDGVHVHSMTPEEAYHGKRGTDWSYAYVYEKLAEAGLNSVPGTAAEVLVDEVRDVICPGKIDTAEWLQGMEGVAEAGLPMTSTLMYGHVENARHRVMHLDVVRDLQDRTGNITEFVPLKFVYPDTPLYQLGMVDGSSSPEEDELMIAVSRLYLDNIANIQVSWVKYGDEFSMQLLNCGGNDFMGTLLSEEITQRAGGGYGSFRSFEDYVKMITSLNRIPVERSTDYTKKCVVDFANGTIPGPMLGPKANGTPLIEKDIKASLSRSLS
jgi:FO synthase subunit 2